MRKARGNVDDDARLERVWAGDDLPPRLAEADPEALALRAHKKAFALALAHQDEDFRRIATERLEASGRIRAEIDACTSWEQLTDLQDNWSEAKRRACLVEARWLVLYADLIGQPDWLSRQVDADRRTDTTERAR